MLSAAQPPIYSQTTSKFLFLSQFANLINFSDFIAAHLLSNWFKFLDFKSKFLPLALSLFHSSDGTGTMTHYEIYSVPPKGSWKFKSMIKICKSKSVDLLWVFWLNVLFLFIYNYFKRLKKKKLRSKVPLIALTTVPLGSFWHFNRIVQKPVEPFRFSRLTSQFSIM